MQKEYSIWDYMLVALLLMLLPFIVYNVLEIVFKNDVVSLLGAFSVTLWALFR